MSGPSKRQKTHNYKSSWEELYCFVDVKGKCVCLLCGASVAFAKKPQQSVFVRPLSKSKNATTASFKIACLRRRKSHFKTVLKASWRDFVTSVKSSV
ncbi:hypothetical protein J437_LFUL012934 [Ladona fulva]|uniref:Uncharacterized protein n=1 Tax=Ladona fulva TaxID=123851 RepID=A0A8K0P2N1_LADFU|nr:hypothetical protein J437_LFUL012934 [Ladona fulva]